MMLGAAPIASTPIASSPWLFAQSGVTFDGVAASSASTQGALTTEIVLLVCGENDWRDRVLWAVQAHEEVPPTLTSTG